MTNFPIHTIDSAPEHSRQALQQLQAAFGMLPNIAGAMATSPVLINSLVGLFGNVHGGSFTEPQITWRFQLTNARVYFCLNARSLSRYPFIVMMAARRCFRDTVYNIT